MDSTSWIIATDSGSYWGRSFGADGVTYVMANAYRYNSAELAAAQIATLAAAGDTRSYHVEVLPTGRRSRY
jgi:hypothetical protein